MTSWLVHKINNHTRKVTMINSQGMQLNMTIPAKHLTHEEKYAYIKGHTDRHEMTSKKSSKYLKISIIFNILISLALLAILARG